MHFFRTLIIAAAVCAMSAISAVAQDFTPVINDIIASYTPWSSAEFSGKLKTDKLPVSPTVKMYMVRDSLLQISVRAPLIGEVGRLNLTRDELLVVNKLKKVYCQEQCGELFEMYPSVLSDIQSLFLGRVAVLGQGELSEINMDIVSIDDDGQGSWILVPRTHPGAIPFNYGYLVGANSRTHALVGTIPGKGSLEIRYGYQNRGEQMDITLDRGNGRQFGAELDFTSVKWGGSEIAPVKLGTYRRVGLKEFINSVK